MANTDSAKSATVKESSGMLHPVDGADQPSDSQLADGPTAESVLNGSGNHVTVFHRPSSHTFNVKVISQEPAVTLFFRKNDSVMDVQFNKQYQTEIKQKQMTVSDEKVVPEDPSVQSIDELLWKEVVLDYRQLLSYYLKLSKIRLTGRCHALLLNLLT